ncbi:hypothetical protein K523DRAFT_322312 [Schizophyllum commune Tattone D]|nr:hypothetical protein K523DRAFT_322312 [Schizophyllum commune Tattone D]
MLDWTSTACRRLHLACCRLHLRLGLWGGASAPETPKDRNAVRGRTCRRQLR